MNREDMILERISNKKTTMNKLINLILNDNRENLSSKDLLGKEEDEMKREIESWGFLFNVVKKFNIKEDKFNRYIEDDELIQLVNEKIDEMASFDQELLERKTRNIYFRLFHKLMSLSLALSYFKNPKFIQLFDDKYNMLNL